MTYLLDTDILIDHLIGVAGTTSLLEAMAEEELAISIITYMEAYEGAYFGDDLRRLKDRFQRLASVLTILPFSLAAARRCAQLRAALRKRGSKVRGRALDVMNAAIAIEYGMTLVTRNTDDYRDIPGLKLYRREERAA